MHEHKEALIINPEVTVLSNPMTIDNRGTVIGGEVVTGE